MSNYFPHHHIIQTDEYLLEELFSLSVEDLGQLLSHVGAC